MISQCRRSVLTFMNNRWSVDGGKFLAVHYVPKAEGQSSYNLMICACVTKAGWPKHIFHGRVAQAGEIQTVCHPVAHPSRRLKSETDSFFFFTERGGSETATLDALFDCCLWLAARFGDCHTKSAKNPRHLDVALNGCSRRIFISRRLSSCSGHVTTRIDCALRMGPNIFIITQSVARLFKGTSQGVPQQTDEGAERSEKGRPNSFHTLMCQDELARVACWYKTEIGGTRPPCRNSSSRLLFGQRGRH